MTNNITIKLLVTLILIIGINGCQTRSTVNNWPNDIPKRSIFVTAFEKQKEQGANSNNLETHLLWIKRFYKGSIIYPIGWNDMIAMVMGSIEEEKKEVKENTQNRLEILGEKIAIEWAQSNNKRNINSSNIATWGNLLRASVKQKQQLSFLSKVERDVDDLIARKIDMSIITRKRYKPSDSLDDYDDF